MSAYPSSVSVSCLCTKVSVQQLLVAPLGSQPPRSFCHCSICRSTSGVLCTSFFALLLTPKSDNNASSLISNPALREYAQSSQLSRWFCGTCGAHVLALLKPQSKYFVAAGLVTPASLSVSLSLSLSESEPETDSVAVHWGVGDTQDGGISVFIPGSRNDSTQCLLLGSTTTTSTTETETANPSQSSASASASLSARESSVGEGKGLLQAQCHCGGVGFAITRPNSRSREPSSPWSDVLVPYHLSSSDNPEDIKWWLRAGDTKYLAGTCACRSCQLASGFPIQCWAFISKANLVNRNSSSDNQVGNEAVGFTYNTGTMQRFESSPGIYREFCSRCDATVFWHCDERPGVVDVSIGLLRSVSGARAEDWLDWETGRVSFAEDAQDKSLVALLEKGLRNPMYC